MTAYTHPAPHRVALPTRAPGKARFVPHVTNRIGALAAAIGLALALLSLYLPWLTTSGGSQITGLGITDILDVRSVAPILFLGLVVLLFLVAVTAATRLGVFAMAGAVVGGIILLAHLAFMWTLVSSTGTGEPLLSGLPSGAAMAYGPFVAAFGFLLVTGGSAWAARSAEYVLPDLESARPGHHHR